MLSDDIHAFIKFVSQVYSLDGQSPAYDSKRLPSVHLFRKPNPKGLIIYLYGVTPKECLSETIKRMYHVSQISDYDVLVPEYPGYGSRPSDKWSFYQIVSEICNLVRFHHHKYDQLILHGMSLGAMIAAMVASRVHTILNAIVLHVPYHDTRYLAIINANIRLPGDMTQLLRHIKTPLAVITARKDPLIPSWHADKILHGAGSRKKIKVVLEDSGHTPHPYWEAYDSIFLRTLKRLMGESMQPLPNLSSQWDQGWVGHLTGGLARLMGDRQVKVALTPP